jgi:hypothetical protein
VWERLRAIRWRGPAVAAIGFGAGSFAVAYWCLTVGTDQLVSYNPGRSRVGSTSLADFLTYGGLTDPWKWIDAVLNVSPWLDITLYGGVLLIPLGLCGLAVADRQRIHLVFVAATMLLFTLATPVSALAYHAWPGMNYFRHIGLVSPLVKVLLCFVAGIAFEWLFDPERRYGRRAVGVAAVAAAVSLVASAWLASHIVGSTSAIRAYVDALSVAGIEGPAHVYEPAIVARRLRAAVNMALAGAAVVGVIPLIIGARTWSPAAARLILCGVLGFVAADVYRFKFAYLFDRSDALGSEGRSLVLASPMTYPRRRERETADVVATNPRASATIGFNQALWRRFQGRSSFGAQYWSNNAFWFTDEAGSTFRTDSWLKPLDQLMRMFSGAPIDDTTAPPAGWSFGTVRFPLDHVAARKVSGVEEDKIRFFVRAYQPLLRSRVSSRNCRRSRAADDESFVPR